MTGNDLEQRVQEVIKKAEAAVENARQYRQDHANQLKEAHDRLLKVKDRTHAVIVASRAALERYRRPFNVT